MLFFLVVGGIWDNPPANSRPHPLGEDTPGRSPNAGTGLPFKFSAFYFDCLVFGVCLYASGCCGLV
jgi:hypothetical protein